MPRHRIVAVALAAALAGAVAGTATAPPAARAAAATATVKVGNGDLNVRSGPGTQHRVVGRAADGSRLDVACQVAGQRITGTVRTTAIWLRIGRGRYVTDAYVSWRPKRPPVSWCAGRARVRTGGTGLNIRTNTSTLLPRDGRIAEGAVVRVRCQLAGETVHGSVRRTALWLRISARGRYISDAYVRWQPRRPELPWCNQPRDAAPQARAAFVRWAAEHAKGSKRRYGVPISVTVAQSILESGWGRSGLTTQGNSYFGIKCFGTPGPVATGCRPYATHECADDECFATSATFRVYRSAARSFADHGRFLTVNPRYRPAFRHTGNPDRFAREIHKAGYATSPTYSSNLIKLMRQFDLYRFDR
jgi:flagellar protein FlgJ